MKFAQPTPELRVPDVVQAQQHYRDHMGFDIGWHDPAGQIGAVSHGECAIFFREGAGTAPPAIFWLFCDDVDGAFADLKDRGAELDGPPVNTSWGMRQFAVRDPYGNQFYIFHDI